MCGTTGNDLFYFNKYSKGEEILHHQFAFQIFILPHSFLFLISLQINCLPTSVSFRQVIAQHLGWYVSGQDPNKMCHHISPHLLTLL